jgi:hypothetical protein
MVESGELRGLAGTCRGMRALVLSYAKHLTLSLKEASSANRPLIATAAFLTAVRRAHGALHFNLRGAAGVPRGQIEAALSAVGSCPAVESVGITCIKVSRHLSSCLAVGLLQLRQAMVKTSPSVRACFALTVMPLPSAVCPDAPCPVMLPTLTCRSRVNGHVRPLHWQCGPSLVCTPLS